MSNPVLDEKKILEINNQLIKLGKKRGYLTYDEINNNFEKVHLDPEMISSFLDLYDAEGIDIVKSEKIVEPQGTEATEEETVLILPEFDNEDEEDDNGQNICHIAAHPILNFKAFAGVGFILKVFPTPAVAGRTENYEYKRTEGQKYVAYYKVFKVEYG